MRFEDTHSFLNSNKLENLITFPVNNFDLSDIVLNHELPHKCLQGTDLKMSYNPFKNENDMDIEKEGQMEEE